MKIVYVERKTNIQAQNGITRNNRAAATTTKKTFLIFIFVNLVQMESYCRCINYELAAKRNSAYSKQQTKRNETKWYITKLNE